MSGSDGGKVIDLTAPDDEQHVPAEPVDNNDDGACIIVHDGIIKIGQRIGLFAGKLLDGMSSILGIPIRSTYAAFGTGKTYIREMAEKYLLHLLYRQVWGDPSARYNPDVLNITQGDVRVRIPVQVRQVFSLFDYGVYGIFEPNQVTNFLAFAAVVSHGMDPANVPEELRKKGGVHDTLVNSNGLDNFIREVVDLQGWKTAIPGFSEHLKDMVKLTELTSEEKMSMGLEKGVDQKWLVEYLPLEVFDVKNKYGQMLVEALALFESMSETSSSSHAASSHTAGTSSSRAASSSHERAWDGDHASSSSSHQPAPPKRMKKMAQRIPSPPPACQGPVDGGRVSGDGKREEDVHEQTDAGEKPPRLSDEELRHMNERLLVFAKQLKEDLQQYSDPVPQPPTCKKRRYTVDEALAVAKKIAGTSSPRAASSFHKRAWEALESRAGISSSSHAASSSQERAWDADHASSSSSHRPAPPKRMKKIDGGRVSGDGKREEDVHEQTDAGEKPPRVSYEELRLLKESLIAQEKRLTEWNKKLREDLQQPKQSDPVPQPPTRKDTKYDWDNVPDSPTRKDTKYDWDNVSDLDCD